MPWQPGGDPIIMPLKIDDLKTFESYKKAIKLDVTRITAGQYQVLDLLRI
jgi:hypothetical protein